MPANRLSRVLGTASFLELSSLAPLRVKGEIDKSVLRRGDLLFLKLKQIPRSANQIGPEWNASRRSEG